MEMSGGLPINILCFRLAEVIAQTAAPLAIAFLELALGKGTNALAMPKSVCEVNPLLMPITFTGWRCEKFINIREGLV